MVQYWAPKVEALGEPGMHTWQAPGAFPWSPWTPPSVTSTAFPSEHLSASSLLLIRAGAAARDAVQDTSLGQVASPLASQVYLLL
jgi:hypothetical protein